MTAPAKVPTPLIFQDPSGSPIANGTVTITLDTDISTAATSGPQITAQRTVKANLDGSGSGTVDLWPNDTLSPAGSVYFVEAFTALGGLAWSGELTVTTPVNVISQYLTNGNTHIRYVNTAGIIDTLTGFTSTDTVYIANGGFKICAGMQLDSSGNLYLADQGAHVIYKISPSLVVTRIAGTGANGSTGDGGNAMSATFKELYQIAFDPAGNLYVQDLDAVIVRVINMQSTTQTLLGISVAPGCIETVAGNGSFGSTGDGGSALSAEIGLENGFAVDASGLYISDSFFNKVRFVNSSGIINTIAGTGTAGNTGNNGPAVSAELHGPTGLTTDAAGNLYIGDVFNNTIRVVNRTAGTLTFFGVSVASGHIGIIAGTGTQGHTGDGGAALSAELDNPFWISFDSTGSMFIEDSTFPQIRMVNASTFVISTVIGTGTAGNSGDGGPATAAEFTDLYSPLTIVR